MRWYSLLVLCSLAIGTASTASAQATVASVDRDGTTPSVAPDQARGRLARFLDPQDGHIDLSRFLATPRAFLPVPIVVTEPAVGYGGGMLGLFIRPRKEAGVEGWARPNISAIGALATANGTWGAFAGDSSRWFDGRLKTLAGVGTGHVNLDFYGLSGDRPGFAQPVRYTLQFTGAVTQGNWQLRPKSPWSVGLRYVYAVVEPQLRDEPVFPGLADGIRVKVSAPTAIVEFDSRDNVFTPTRGIFAESSWLASRESLGASDEFDRFQQLLMGWYPLAKAVTLGARGNYAWSSAGTPVFLRPYVLLRGVPAVRYQGDEAASLEVEARWQFSSRWSAVAFGGGGRTVTSRERSSITQSVASGGVGFRYALARKFGMHVGIDVAHSPGTNAIYLQVGNAWFRP